MNVSNPLHKLAREMIAADTKQSLRDVQEVLREMQEDWFKSLGEAFVKAVRYTDYVDPSIEHFTSESLRFSHGYMDLDDPNQKGPDRVQFVFELKRGGIHFWVLYNKKQIAHTTYSTAHTIDFLVEKSMDYSYGVVEKEFS